jgi:hypothetical protein
MRDRSFDKQGFVASEFVLDSSSVAAKKAWQPPQLIEIDYSKTNEGTGTGGDGAFRDFS